MTAGPRRFGSTSKVMTRTQTRAWRDWKRRANISGMNSSSDCGCDERQSCISGWTVRNRKRREWTNCWRGPRKGLRRTRTPGEKRHNDVLEDVLRRIGEHERFVLTSHARPDGDAVGSALACCQILRAMGKHADVVLHDGVPRVYQPLPFADTVVRAVSVEGNYEAA